MLKPNLIDFRLLDSINYTNRINNINIDSSYILNVVLLFIFFILLTLAIIFGRKTNNNVEQSPNENIIKKLDYIAKNSEKYIANSYTIPEIKPIATFDTNSSITGYSENFSNHNMFNSLASDITMDNSVYDYNFPNPYRIYI